MPYVTVRTESRQYDGTDAEDLVTWIGDASIVSVDDGVLTLSLTVYGLTYETQLLPGSWVLRQDGQCTGVLTAEEYQRNYYELPTPVPQENA